MANIASSVVASMVLIAFAAHADAQDSSRSLTQPEAPAINPGALTTKPTAVQLHTWRRALMEAPRPEKACYAVTYPDTQWHKVACKPKSTKLYPPRRESTIIPELVGEGSTGGDFSATVTGDISEAEGSFDTTGTVVGSEGSVPCDQSTDTCAPGLTPGAPGAIANDFSLQLNTKPFDTSVCGSSKGVNGNPCQGWEQFVYSSEGNGSIQYWLVNFGPTGATCPGLFQQDGYPGVVDCYYIVSNSTSVPGATASSLPEITVTGSTAGLHGSSTDTLTIFVGGSGGSSPGDNLFPDLGTKWKTAEFNVFGDGNDSQAAFSSGSTVIPRIGVTSGTTGGPACDLESFTGESNNLTLGASPPTMAEDAPAPGVTPMPALVFTESVPPGFGAPGGCADAASIGDTHLTRFDGLKYDFQATGDFLLAQSGDFTVQTRQALSVTNPNWLQNAAINKAVAVQMGHTRVELYIWPVRLVVDGRTLGLTEGKTISLPGGVNVALRDGIYVIAARNGNAAFAQANNNGINSWLNVWVRLGHTPAADTRGLLANPLRDVHQLTTADGVALIDVSFADLYHRYADGWRVAPGQSMLEPDRKMVVGVPARPLFAADLDVRAAQKGRAACEAAGVTAKTLLDDCILDTAVLGDATAAKVYTRLRLPRLVLARPLLVKP